MPYAAYPAVSDVQNVWVATGLFSDPTQVPQASIPWAARLAKAIAWIEDQTGRQFLPVAQTRTYDPPLGARAVIPLDRDLIRLTGAVQIQGTTLTTNADFYLGPPNADQNGRPWAWIEFVSYFPSPLSVYQRKSITVPGIWGYCDDGNGNPAIPGDVWDAVCEKAAALCLPEMLLAVSDGLVEMDKATYMERGVNPLTVAATGWLASAQETADAKRRVTLF